MPKHNDLLRVNRCWVCKCECHLRCGGVPEPRRNPKRGFCYRGRPIHSSSPDSTPRARPRYWSRPSPQYDNLVICSAVQDMLYSDVSVRYPCGFTAPNTFCDTPAVNIIYPSGVGGCRADLNLICDAPSCS